MEDEQNPFESDLFRTFLGLSSGLMIAIVAVFFFDGILRWALIAFAAFDAVFTPYVLGKVIEQNQRQNDPTTR